MGWRTSQITTVGDDVRKERGEVEKKRDWWGGWSKKDVTPKVTE